MEQPYTIERFNSEYKMIRRLLLQGKVNRVGAKLWIRKYGMDVHIPGKDFPQASEKMMRRRADRDLKLLLAEENE